MKEQRVDQPIINMEPLRQMREQMSRSSMEMTERIQRARQQTSPPPPREPRAVVRPLHANRQPIEATWAVADYS